MPPEPRLFVKTGFVYLVLTFVAGAGLLIAEAVGRQVPFVIQVEHGHLGSVGWLVNVVMGVALWMFPLDQARFPQTRGRYPVAAALTTYWLLNVGLALRIVVEPWFQLGGPQPVGAALLIFSALMQMAAIIIFAAIIWRRVRGPAGAAPR